MELKAESTDTFASFAESPVEGGELALRFVLVRIALLDLID